MDKSLSRTHDTSTDILRIISAFGVIMIHSSGFTTFSGIFLDSISRFSVPIFVLISGYYMLSRSQSYASLFRKSGKLFLNAILVSSIFWGYELFWGSVTYNGFASVITYILTEPSHLWYIYAAITLYCFTPILRIISQSASKKDFHYTLIFSFFFGSFIIILLRTECFPLLSTIIGKMKVPYTQGFIFLYLLGGYFNKYGLPSKHNRHLIYLLGLLGTGISFVSTCYLSQSKHETDLLLSFFAPNVIVSSIAIFILFRHYFSEDKIQSNFLKGMIKVIADRTLGIYLLHPLIISIFKNHICISFFHEQTFASIFLCAIISFTLSFAVSALLAKLPILKWIIS